MSINILKELKIILVKKFDKYDYNFKYRFIWIKFHKKIQWKERTLLKLQKQNMSLQNFDDEI